MSRFPNVTRIIFLLNRKIILAFPLMLTIPVMILMADS